MREIHKTKRELTGELVKLRQRITELEKSETEYKKIKKNLENEKSILKKSFENLPVLAYKIGLDGKVLDCNRRTVKTLGYKSKKELIGRSLITTIYAPSSQEKAKRLFLKWKKTGKLGDEELQVITKQGKVRDVLLNLDIIYDRTGKPLHSISTQVDITERKQTEEEIKQLTHDLRERIKELDCFYRICEISRKEGISIEAILKEIVQLIPPGWQYPEITGCSITCEGKKCKTKNFKVTKWMQREDIIIDNEKSGLLEVCYLEEKPEMDEGPFLKAERNLIKAITVQLGIVISRKRAFEALREQKLALAQKNIALREVIAQIEMEKRRIEDDIEANVNVLIFPILKKLKLKNDNDKNIDLVQHILKSLTSSFGTKITEKRLNFTPKEIEICSMVKENLSIKEISRLLNISWQTVVKHRHNIRRKLGISNKSINLISFLREI